MASLLLPGCLPFEFLERAQEGQQGLALLGGQVDHLLPCRRRLAAVPEHRLEQTPRAPVVQKAGVAVDRLGEADPPERRRAPLARSEEHTSELQSLMRISYAVFCLKKSKDALYDTTRN